MALAESGFESGAELGALVVLFHGYTNGPKDMESIESLVNTRLRGARVIKPQMPLSRWSTADPNEVVLSLLEKIGNVWRVQGRGDIIFIGHSIGGLLARKVYVVACGPTKDAPFSNVLNLTVAQPWAARVKRIILLAGMNRGWEVSYHFSLKRAIIWTLGVWIANFIALVSSRPPLMLHMRRGAGFLTQLRLEWLAMRKHSSVRGTGGALTVQLLGSTDDVVSPEDNIDLISGRDFIYLDVPNTSHANIIQVDPHFSEKDSRSGILFNALTLDLDALKERAVAISDQPLPNEEPNVRDVIFVVHGIRDVGYWTQKIARRVIARSRIYTQEKAPSNPRERVFAMETASYGYFPMAPFLFASRRQQKVEWLMNQYAEAVANYPNAKFSCIAHSNGTYLVAKALEEYAACRFKRIVFAGSVVRRNFDWTQYINAKRVDAVLNYVATDDWVVAFFPKLFELLRIQDLGTAGFDGFADQDPASLWQVCYVKGDHGAALREEHWDDIADFIVKPVTESHPLPQPLPQPEGFPQSWWMRIVSQWPPLVWAIILALLTGVGWLIAWIAPNDIIRTAALLLYLKVLWEIVTRL
jgi:pimeloyl-ACP methyl ester carboxylesterase